MTWRMRRVTASEGPQLWHLEKSMMHGNYVTVCGVQFGGAGSSYIVDRVPGSACAKCLKSITQGVTQ